MVDYLLFLILFLFESDWPIGRLADWWIKKDWNQFRNLDLLKIKKLLKSPLLLDLRNLYDPAKAKDLGFIYEGVGRK